MPDNKEQNPKAGKRYKPNGKGGHAQHPHSPEEPQSEEATPNASHKRQRRIEDWFPN